MIFLQYLRQEGERMKKQIEDLTQQLQIKDEEINSKR